MFFTFLHFQIVIVKLQKLILNNLICLVFHK